jgi:hypothetical protein
LYLFGKRRLTDVQRFGGLTEVEAVGEHNERAQLREFESHSNTLSE